jgi:hypothetical protein
MANVTVRNRTIVLRTVEFYALRHTVSRKLRGEAESERMMNVYVEFAENLTAPSNQRLKQKRACRREEIVLY